MPTKPSQPAIAPRGPSGVAPRGLSPAVKKADASFGNKPVGKAVNACVVHWFAILLRRQFYPGKRPAWWTPEKHPGYAEPYPFEPYEANTTAGKKTGMLSANGMVSIGGIPAGICQCQFKQFHTEIKKQFDKELK
jgi:hypothetical protein